MRAQYQTRQRNELLDFLQEHTGTHFTAAEIQKQLKDIGISIGTATIYRQLEKLTDGGSVVKYVNEPGTSACFEYLPPEDQEEPEEEFHCKCVRCGILMHIECKELAGIGSHLLEHHHFLMDPRRTVFYGLCDKCRTTAKSSQF